MRLLILLGLASFASNISVRSVDPMLPLIADYFGISLHRAAWLVTAYGIPYALSQPILGPVADAFGKVRVIKIALSLLAVGFAFCAVAPSFPLLIAARILTGLFAGGVVPVAFAYLGDRVPYNERQFAISRVLIMVIFGQMGGATMAGVLGQLAGWRVVFFVSTAIVGVIALLILFLLKGGDEATRKFSLSRALADYRFLLTDRAALTVYATVLCEGLFVYGVFPFVAPILMEHGSGGTAVAGFVIGAFALGGIVYAVSARQVVRALGPWNMMRVGGVTVGLCYLIVSMPVPWIAMAVLFAIAGFGYYLLHNTMQVQGTELAPQARGAAVALFASAFFVGQGLGPVFTGYISEAFGFSVMFIGIAGLVALLGLISARLLRKTEPAPQT
jgi:DHA1 family inner membrane transport protein